MTVVLKLNDFTYLLLSFSDFEFVTFVEKFEIKKEGLK